MQHPLAGALRSAGIGKVEVATRLGVDPKTVERWIAGRTPYPRYRRALADLTSQNMADLWPEAAARPGRPPSQRGPIAYQHWGAVPTDAWVRLFRSAQAEIDILAYGCLFIVDESEIQRALVDRAEAGVAVRLALDDPSGDRVRTRGEEEHIDAEITARVNTALATLGALQGRQGIEVRMHNTTLYNSIYRVDNEVIVNMHVFGMPAASAPVLHLRADRDHEVTQSYRASFERVWNGARPATLRSE